MLLLRVMTRFDNVQSYADSLGVILRDLRPALLQRRGHYFEAEAKVFAEVLDQGQKSGLFRVSDRFVTANALIEATNSVLPLSLTEEELNHRARVEKRIGHIADLLVTALVQRGRLYSRSRAVR